MGHSIRMHAGKEGGAAYVLWIRPSVEGTAGTGDRPPATDVPYFPTRRDAELDGRSFSIHPHSPSINAGAYVTMGNCQTNVNSAVLYIIPGKLIPFTF